MNDLGTRIKELRKEKKMTLAELAGDRLTKGMLSLIENGKVNPSMKSLQYIAHQLNVEVSLLLNSGHIEKIRELLLEVEEEYKNIQEQINNNDNDHIKQILTKIDSIQHLLLGNNFEEIRLLDLKIRLKSFIKEDEIQLDEMFTVINSYENIHAYSRIISCYSFLSLIAFKQYNYKQSLQYMQQAKTRIEPYIHLIDNLTKLDMYYLLTIFYAAIDDGTNTEKHLEDALEIAHKNKIYYRLDDFYRFTLVQAIGNNDRERSKYYITKLKQHAEFTEDTFSNFIFNCCEAFYTNIIEKDYQKTLVIAKKARKYPVEQLGVLKYLSDYIVPEETYALWALGLYKEAINLSQNFKISSLVLHPYDLATMYKCFAVRALCHFEIGDREAAIRDILYASNGVKDFPKTIDKLFIDNAYKKIL